MKKTLSCIFTIILSLVFALSFAVVTRLVRPAESLNALWLITASGCFFLLIYRFYGAFLSGKVLSLNNRNKTPAYEHEDGQDYYPTNRLVLFGHHFAAIAGAGPLIGPVLAAQFGYLPGFLWILIGAAFGGAVHDMVILLASVRRGGCSLAVGMAYIFSALPGMKGLMPYWYNFALMFEALFILTTVDTGTRVARYIVQEFGGRLYAPLGVFNWTPGVIISSAIVVLAWGLLITSGSISTIWPMFGVANQLLAVLALSVGTTILIKMEKVAYIWVTLIPMLFMFVITVTASWELVWIFMERAASMPKAALTYRLDALLVGLMAFLAIVAVADSAIKWRKMLFGGKLVIEGG